MSRPLAGRALPTLGGAPTPAAPAGARFAVDRLDVDDELLTVEGRWSGIRGLRFLRPTLVVDGRPVLATLAHKPWAASENERWTAAFPWTGDPERLRRAWLQVAPSVIVPLGDGSRARPAPPAAPLPKAEAVADASTAEVGAVAEQAPTEVKAAARELEHMRRELRSAQAERDRAEAMRDEAVRDREAALRTRERMSRARDESAEAQEAAIVEAQRRAEQTVAAAERRVAEAERTREQAFAERDAARADEEAVRGAHEQVRLQRDEALAAYRRVAEDAPQDPGAAEPPEAARPYPAVEVPLGVRALPAVSARRPDMSRARPQPGTLSAFDHWALRVLAITAASCFVLLMFLLVRVFS